MQEPTEMTEMRPKEVQKQGAFIHCKQRIIIYKELTKGLGLG